MVIVMFYQKWDSEKMSTQYSRLVLQDVVQAWNSKIHVPQLKQHQCSINVSSMFPAMASRVRPIRTSLHPSGLSPNPPRKARPNPLAAYKQARPGGARSDFYGNML